MSEWIFAYNDHRVHLQQSNFLREKNMAKSNRPFTSAVLAGLVTILILVTGWAASVVVYSLFHGGLPAGASSATRFVLSILVPLIILLISGALWGRSMARLTGNPETRRMAWAGALGWGPTVLVIGIVLRILEAIMVTEQRFALSPPVVFTVLFVPAAFIITGAGGLALGRAQRDTKPAWRLALGSAVLGGLGFLIVNLILHASGWVIGAPGAAEHNTTMNLGVVSTVGAAGLAGGWIGWQLSSRRLP